MATLGKFDTLPPVLPPIAAASPDWRRGATPADAFGWLAAGWRDFATRPGLSLAYGGLIFVVSLLIVWGLVDLGYDYILFPSLSGFLVVAPLAATGLYEKSRRLAAGDTVTLADMLFVRIRSGGQIVFVGLLLLLLMLLWNRAAVLLFALFFGLLPFPSFDHVLPVLLGTPLGLLLLVVGSLVGGLFAAFSFAVSVFAIPRLLDHRTDALSAMGRSMAIVSHNLPVMLTWAAIVVALFALSVATALVGLVVVFPLLGHATWHAYVAMRGPAETSAPATSATPAGAPA